MQYLGSQIKCKSTSAHIWSSGVGILFSSKRRKRKQTNW